MLVNQHTAAMTNPQDKRQHQNAEEQTEKVPLYPKLVNSPYPNP